MAFSTHMDTLSARGPGAQAMCLQLRLWNQRKLHTCTCITSKAKDRNCVQYNSNSESNSTKQFRQNVSNLSFTVPFQHG